MNDDNLDMKIKEYLLLKAKTDYEFTINQAINGNIVAAQNIDSYRFSYLIAKNDYEFIRQQTDKRKQTDTKI